MIKSKYTIAAEKRWKNVSPEKRSERASASAKARWKKINKEERRKLALKLVRAKKKKWLTKKQNEK